MEKTKLLNNTKKGEFNNKEKVGNKIESLWGENSSVNNKSKYESKKLLIKLEETTRREKRKLLLKLESGSPTVHSSNYHIISELLKEFFNGNSSFE